MKRGGGSEIGPGSVQNPDRTENMQMSEESLERGLAARVGIGSVAPKTVNKDRFLV